MAALKDTRMESFAELVAIKGLPYRKAAEALEYKGMSICTNPKVRKRIAELRELKAIHLTVTAAISRKSVLDLLWEIAQDTSEPTAQRIKAAELCGKEINMFHERVDIYEHLPASLEECSDEQLEFVQMMVETLSMGREEAIKRAEQRRVLASLPAGKPVKVIAAEAAEEEIL